METFSALLALCAENSPVTGEFPSKRPVTRSFDIFSDMHMNKRLNKQSWCWWFETSSRSLWRHCNAIVYSTVHSGADQRKYQSPASLAFVWGIHRWPVNSPHKWPVTRKMFPFDDVIMFRFHGPTCWLLLMSSSSSYLSELWMRRPGTPKAPSPWVLPLWNSEICNFDIKSETTWIVFPWMKIIQFVPWFYWTLCVRNRLTINHLYLNLWRPSLLMWKYVISCSIIKQL